MHVLWVRQDGPADEPSGSRAPGGAGSGAGAAGGGGSGDAGEAAEPLDTLSDVESDEAEEDRQCAAPAGGTLCMSVSFFAAQAPWTTGPMTFFVGRWTYKVVAFTSLSGCCLQLGPEGQGRY